MNIFLYFDTSRERIDSSFPIDSKSVCGTLKSPKTLGPTHDYSYQEDEEELLLMISHQVAVLTKQTYRFS